MNKYFQLLLIFLFFLTTASGSKQYIKSIEFEGNNSIKSSELSKLIRSKSSRVLSRQEFNQRRVQLDQLTIKNYYFSKGFLQADVSLNSNRIDTRWININFNVKEGKQYFVNAIELYGNNLISDEEIHDIIHQKTGEKFNPLQLRNDLSQLKNHYLNRGKALVNIVDEIDQNGNMITIRINIAEGSLFYIGEINIQGIESSMERFIQRELQFKSGDRYEIATIIETQKYIYSSGIFSSVEITPSVLTADNKVNLDIHIREMDTGNIIGEFGFGQTPSALGEGASPITIFQGGGKWQITNVFNSGAKIGFNVNLGIRIDEIISLSTKKFEISTFSPWIFKFRLPINLKYYFEESTEEGFLRRQGLRTSFLYKSGKKYRLNGDLDIEMNQASGDAPIDQERSLEMVYIFHNTDNFITPSNGNYFSFSTDLRGTILGGSRHYLKLESEYRHYFPLYNKFILAGRYQVGFIKIIPYKNETSELPIYDRLYLGGSTSMRAWEEDGLVDSGGKLKYLMNFELRFPLFWKLGGELFFDSGRLLEDENDLSKPEWDWDVGYGITFITPLGPMRLDVAYKYGEGIPTISNALLYIF